MRKSDGPRNGTIQVLSDGSCPYFRTDFCASYCKVKAWCIHIRREDAVPSKR